MTTSHLPALRLRARGTPNPRGRWVLYWMTAARRCHGNFALQRAAELAARLDVPLVVLEPLRCGYRWASDRLHRFVLDGMADNAADLAATGALYHPYVEPEPGAGRGLLAALAASASAVVTDDSPAFFYRRMLAAAARQVTTRFEIVDGNGLLPLRATDTVFPTAYAFRRFLQRELRPHLAEAPALDPLDGPHGPRADALPAAITDRWPRAGDALLAGDRAALAALPIDHGVAPGALRGGARQAEQRLGTFVAERLPRYAERNQPQDPVTSELSPYLHFGHIGSHAILAAVAAREDWSPAALTDGGRGARQGWWQLSAPAEAFLDQLVTWRELGFNMAHLRSDHETYESLPGWARATLEQHADDPREQLYELEQLQAGQTHDPLWNAAQGQLRATGTLHNYLRMLWGKRVLEWTPSPRAALDVLLQLNNRYALDGRDPNSTSGIFWCLGRYDRAWGPERPVFGKLRYMSSTNTARKLRVKEYVARWTSPGLSGNG